MNKKPRGVVSVGFDLIKKYPKIFHNFYKTPFYNDEPKIFQYNVAFLENGFHSEFAIATGTSFSKEIALQKLFGELVERYSLSINPRNLLTGRFKKGGEMLDPLQFLSFSESQLQVMKVKKGDYLSASYSWVEAQDAYSNHKFFLPAQLIYVPYKRGGFEPYLDFGTSSGAACGATFGDAIYAGACELIERDSFLITYLNKIPCPLIDLRSIDDHDIQDVIGKIERYNLKIYIIETTTDLSIFSVCVIVVDETGFGPSVSMGLKAGLEKKPVIIGAMEEALMTRAWIRDKLMSGDKNKVAKPNEIETIPERALYWSGKEKIGDLDFWLNGASIGLKINRNERRDLSRILKKLKSAGIRLYFTEITSNLIEKDTVHVVKVVSPDLQPMYLDERYKYLGKKRLYTSPKRMGYKTRRESDLNDIPHPFL